MLVELVLVCEFSLVVELVVELSLWCLCLCLVSVVLVVLLEVLV